MTPQHIYTHIHIYAGAFLVLVLALVATHYIFPAISWKHRKYRRDAKKLHAKISAIPEDGQRMAYLKRINPYVFEELILYALKKRGYKVKPNKAYSGDGGIDGRFYVNKELYYIQAKRYAGHINKKHVEEFDQVVTRDKVRGIFCHTGTTGAGSKETVRASERVILYSGSKLLKLLFPKQSA